MNIAEIIDTLGLPSSTRIDMRIPKKLLAENGAPTPGDLRQINEGIENLQWIAVLKPTTIGIAEYRNSDREILEIVVLYLTLRAGAKSGRLAELVHRAVPYPVVLIIEQGTSITLSLAQKRSSQIELGKTVLDGEVIETRLDDESGVNISREFRESLTLARQPQSTLNALYQGWIDTIFALQASQITGIFSILSSEENLVARREALLVCRDLESQIATLKIAAAKEKQLPRQVEFNLKLKRLQDDYAAKCARL